MRWLPVLIVCVSLGTGGTALAEPAKTPDVLSASEEPIDITADESLEWRQAERLYIARGNAKAVKGTMTVEADVLTAHEREKDAPETPKQAGEGGLAGSDIGLLTAEGNVRLYDDRQKVSGDRAVYDLDSRIAKITGSSLKYETPNDTVTARDSLEYHEGKNLAVARGKAVAVHKDRRVEADVLTARFARTAAGQLEMVDMTAEGRVTVVTGNDVSRGDRAVYDIKRNVAVMTGHVRVTRGETQLSGDRAEVDFTKGESRLVNMGPGRVRALMIPKDKGKQKVGAGPKTGLNGKMDAASKIGQKAGAKDQNP